MNKSPFFARQPKPVIVAMALAIVVVIGWVDWVTGREISLFVFYSLPILLVVWYADRTTGIMFSFLCAAVWWWANLKVHTFKTAWGYPIATFSRLGFNIFVAVGGAALKAKQDADQAQIEALERTRELELEIIRVSEHEQRRIGQDLHDGLCQTLAAIGCAATSLKDDLQPISPTHAAAANEIEKYLQDAVVEARNLARGISPVDMNEHGLVAALDVLAEMTSRLTNVPVTFESPEEIGRVDESSAIHLYRIAQEAVNNAMRHAHAKQVNISLVRTNDVLTLTVADDGTGLPREAASGQGMGLKTMRYRAHLIGANLRVANHPNSGVRVACAISSATVAGPLLAQAS